METQKDILIHANFLNDKNKLNLLKQANELLHINKSIHKPVLFVYSAPKVGSTSIVSSFRIFGLNIIDTIHIHDETMLLALGNINGISINEIIVYNKHLGKNVYVINIYRSPIERKISSFFEKIGCYHFNTTEQNVNNFDIEKIIHRFNNIFTHLDTTDHFIDKYNILVPETFNYKQKYLLVRQNNINYITLRLKDSEQWGETLTSIFGFKLQIVKDYESNNKAIKDIYRQFKQHYKIPINFLNDTLNCKYLKYYYSPIELEEYYNEWLINSTTNVNSYTNEQYKVYNDIMLENSCNDVIQTHHYIDDGCKCHACGLKRLEISTKIIKGTYTNETIIHSAAALKIESIKKQIRRISVSNNNNMRKKCNNHNIINKIFQF